MKQKTLTGILDTNLTRALGEIIIFLEELLLIAQTNSISEVDIVVIHDDLEIDPAHLETNIPEKVANHKGIFAVDVLGGFAAVRSIRLMSRLYLDRVVDNENNLTWPRQHLVKKHDYDSMTRIQSASHRGSRVIPLELRPDFTKWARKLLTDIGKVPCVAVHLKKMDRLDESNAKMEAWHEFFVRARKESPTKFVLVGDDLVDPQIMTCSNVVRTANKTGVSIGGHLAVIQESSAFMGMMSGPSNIAIFDRKPYAIFKNPKHHRKQMIDEIGSNERYAFSTMDQRIIREYETSDLLWYEFQRMIKHLDEKSLGE